MSFEGPCTENFVQKTLFIPENLVKGTISRFPNRVCQTLPFNFSCVFLDCWSYCVKPAHKDAKGTK